MAKSRALDKRRKSVRNIRKITRTMELIATARFKKAADRAGAANAYTRRITQLVADLAAAGLSVSHPLLEPRAEVKRAKLLMLTSNRGLCGGYNGGVIRQGLQRYSDLETIVEERELDVSGKRGIGALKFRGVTTSATYTHFEDKPTFAEVEVLANKYLAEYLDHKIDRLDVAYTRFESMSRQTPVVETLLPLGKLTTEKQEATSGATHNTGASEYEFLPSAQSILEEVVPTSFKVRLYKCFLDAAVSEQIARMIAMKGATDAAGKMIKQLTLEYNRARQSQITNEIIEIIGGASALEG
jgi:F-type H+-transporting ATPase subunit gamma